MNERTLPMFPLGLVLVPGALLPLHIFEDRYRALVRDCLAGDADFGVVLIERGNEVGGGDVRSDVGTVAHIVDGHAFDDGRFALMCAGTERIRVIEWLPDDPYPRAVVAPWPDPPAPITPEVRDRLMLRLDALATAKLRAGAASPTAELADDPSLATYQAAVLADVGTYDLQRVLTCPDVGTRCDLVSELLDDLVRVLDAGQ